MYTSTIQTGTMLICLGYTLLKEVSCVSSSDCSYWESTYIKHRQFFPYFLVTMASGGDCVSLEVIKITAAVYLWNNWTFTFFSLKGTDLMRKSVFFFFFSAFPFTWQPCCPSLIYSTPDELSCLGDVQKNTRDYYLLILNSVWPTLSWDASVSSMLVSLFLFCFPPIIVSLQEPYAIGAAMPQKS